MSLGTHSPLPGRAGPEAGVSDAPLPPDCSPESALSASAVLSALSFALDLTEGQPMGHAMQTCLIGMRIATTLGLPPAQQSDLYYALLLKDAGCSSNATKLFQLLQSDEIRAKRDLKDKDWTRPSLDRIWYTLDHLATGKPFLERAKALVHLVTTQEITSRDLIKLRCERGASIARQIGFSLEVAMAIGSLDEHWDGRGHPMGIQGLEIPLLSRIMNLAQTLAVFWTLGGPKAATDMLDRRDRRWFDPELVRIARSLHAQGTLWAGLGDEDLFTQVSTVEPAGTAVSFVGADVDQVCLAFSEVIDSKSPFTYRHSQGVAQAAVEIGRHFGLPEHEISMLHRGGLLHDIGKLSVPSSILEKPGKLDDAEFAVVKKHPFYTLEILRRIPGFGPLSEFAASHHERLDGSGYFRGHAAKDLSLHARILAVADVYDALRAERPYRGALPLEMVFSIMDKEAPHALDPECLYALHASPASLPILLEHLTREAVPGVACLVPEHVF